MNTSKLLDLLHPGKYSRVCHTNIPSSWTVWNKAPFSSGGEIFRSSFKVLSVRKVVPTLTSTSAEIYLSMAGAKQHNDMGFILVPAVGRTSSRGALEAMYCVAP
jgi:hypothetical protein